MTIELGDVVVAGHHPGLVIDIWGKTVFIRKFRFTPGGQWRGSYVTKYPIESVNQASKTQVNSVYSQAIKAVSFNRFSVPRKIFLMITGGKHE